MKNPIRILPLLVVSLLAACAFAASAHAVDNCPPDCEDPEPTEHTWNETLTVQKTAGTVTGGGIDCGSTCSTAVEVSMICTSWSGCGEPLGDTVTLTASPPGAGWSPVWSGCDSSSGTTCSVYVDAPRTVSLSWSDVGDPSVAIGTVAAKAGASVAVSASASDNAGVQRVEYYVDGAKQAQSSAGGAWGAQIDMSGYAHGSTHQVTAKAFDVNGRASALSAARTVAVDHQVALTLGATPAAGGYTKAATAPLTIATDADVPAGNRKCGLLGGTLAACASPYAPALTAAGSYTYVVEVTDDVGNKATATRQFTVDRTAPSASFTDGPDEGATVGTTTVTISFSSADSSPRTITCSVDGAAAGPCTTAGTHTLSGLADGTHTLTVKVTDAAGNAREIKRTFAVKSVEPEQPGGGTEKPGGGTENPGGGTGNPGGGAENPGGGTTTTTTTVTTTTTNGAQPFLPLIGHDSSTRGAWTKFKLLRVRNLPAGSKVTLTCKGGGCALRSKSYAATGAPLNLVKALKGRRLRAGAVLEIRVTGPAGEVKVARYTSRRGKAPARSDRCAAAGGALGRCA